MKSADRQQLSVKCECIVTRNNIQVNGKKKSKFSLIKLNADNQSLIVQPFGSQKEEQKLAFPLIKLKAIHKKYIEEGKITFEFLERMERLQLKGTDVANPEQSIELTSQILISSASKENLELLIKKIVAIKTTNTEAKNTPQRPKEHIKKRPVEVKDLEEKQAPPLSRKELMMSAMQPERTKKTMVKMSPQVPRIAFFDLPTGIISQIFQFCSVELWMRVISRRFSEYVLSTIRSIRLSDEVDERSFNRLAKWAVDVECRLKNVRNLELSDKHEEQELVKGRAKTLKFGSWKEISPKNIMQLKGLRIYCLEMPYFLKFDLSHLFGLRMVELRLKAPTLTSNRCELVKTEDLVYLLKTVRDLRALELPFANSDLLTAIEHPKRITELKIYYLSDNVKEEVWKDFSRFENLKTLSLWMVEKQGSRKEDHELTLRLPDGLKQLEVGSFISKESLEKLPLSLEYLKVIGENFYNSHIESIYLPNLQLLDISMSRNVRQDVLEFVQNLAIVTYWERNTLDYVANYAASKGIKLTTRNPDFK